MKHSFKTWTYIFLVNLFLFAVACYVEAKLSKILPE